MKVYDYIESEDYYEMATEWLDKKEYIQAIDCLKRTIELNPNFIYAYITMAKAYSRQREFVRAVHILKKASKIDPLFHQLNYLMAKFAFKGGDFPASLKYINMAIDKDAMPLYLKSREIIRKACKKI